MLDAAALDRLSRELGAPSGGDGLDAAQERGQRRAQGAYFTPAPLVDFVVDAALSARFARPVRWADDGTPRVRVLDPSAGDGRFLASALRWLVARAVERGARPGPDLERAIARRCLMGIERSESFAVEARRRVRDASFLVAEALLGAPIEDGVDVVVGNPPYLRSINLERTDPALWAALRGRFAATSFGEWDLYGAFIERALEWLGPHGHVGFVVPSRWLTARFAGPLRGLLARRNAVRAVVDFGAEQLFDGATTYPSVVLLSRPPGQRVFVGRRDDAGWRTGELDCGALGDAPWQLSVGELRAQLDRLVAGGLALGDVARIVKGCGTNADRVFALERPERRAELLVGHSRALDATVAVESNAARACLRGRDVGGFELRGEVACVYPYDRAGNLIDPTELQSRWPHCWSYLQRTREVLDARERGRFRGPRFYRFGRPQNLEFFADPAAKVVVPDVARGGRAAIERRGRLCLDTAYALRPRPGAPAHVTVELLAAVLNSRVAALWLAETGVPLRGNYVRMKTAYLAGMPVPRAATPASEVTRLVRCRAPIDRIEVALEAAYGAGIDSV